MIRRGLKVFSPRGDRLSEDSFTVTLDQPYTVGNMVADGLQVTADYKELLNSPKQGQYGVAQGAATDGTYIYPALRNSDDSGSVITKHRLDADLNYVTSYDRTKPSGYTAQGMGSDEQFIYFPMSGNGQNILDTFDWKGNPVCHIILPTPHESESLFYTNGRHFVSFNYNGATVYEIFFRCVLQEE